jgi:hypothetical protein
VVSITSTKLTAIAASSLVGWSKFKVNVRLSFIKVQAKNKAVFMRWSTQKATKSKRKIVNRKKLQTVIISRLENVSMATVNRFEYADRCPTCLAEGARNEGGKEYTLGFDVDKGEISCLRGHVFQELPSEITAAPVVERPAEDETMLAMPEPATPPDENRLAEIMQQRKAAEEKPEQKLADVVVSGAPTGTTPATVVGYDTATTFSTLLTVAEGQTLSLLNGDILVGIRISEQWRQAVEAEAEAKGMKTAEYFQQWLQSDEMRDAVSDLLANYWTSNYAQAR